MSNYRFESKFIKRKVVAPQMLSATVRKSSVSKKLKPRVLMVGTHLTKTRGGITTLIAEILKSPLKEEFDFHYIESQAEDFGKIGKTLLALAAVARFLWICPAKRPDLIYVHLGSNASLYRESVFIFLAKIFRKKVVAHFHAGDIDDYYPLQNRLGQRFIRLSLGLSDYLIAVSRESARQLKNIVKSPNISVIANAIDTSVFDFSDRRHLRQDDAARLLFVGATGKLKGERDLIKALAILRGTDGKSKIKVSFLGYGAENLANYCQKLGVAEYIEFLGAVSIEERVAFFQKADIFVLPTYAEAMPMSVIEAMASGLPVISTTVGGIPEIVEDGADGFLIPPGDVEALAKKISYLLENECVRVKVGAKARQKALEQMDFQQYTNKLRGLLSTACQTKYDNMTNTKLIIKRSIKSAASIAKARVGFPALAPGSVNIIAYHRVVADIAKAERESIYGLVVSADTFRLHCKMLRKAFDVVSLETAMYFLSGERKVRRPLAAITFDDGYLDFYEEAFPILNDLGLPATVFLPTECVGLEQPLAHDRIFWLLEQARLKSASIESALIRAGFAKKTARDFAALRDRLKLTEAMVYLPNDLRERVIVELENEIGDFAEYPREYRLLNWEMAREMARKGINFGAHTANHVVLPLEDESAAKAEITDSKKELERQLNKKAVSFAYPNGEYNAKIRRLIAEAGYKIAVTTEKRVNRPGADLLALGRISLCEESTRGIKGVYSPGVANFRLGI